MALKSLSHTLHIEKFHNVGTPKTRHYEPIQYSQ